jgi:hypothetical protein
MIVKLYHSVGYFPESGNFISFGLYQTREEAEHGGFLKSWAWASSRPSGGDVRHAVLECMMLVDPIKTMVSVPGKGPGDPDPELETEVFRIEEQRKQQERLEAGR